jgi:hypothetical protein
MNTRKRVSAVNRAIWPLASRHPDLPDANHQIIAEFVAHGFAGAIKAWLSDDSVTKTDLSRPPSPAHPSGGADPGHRTSVTLEPADPMF